MGLWARTAPFVRDYFLCMPSRSLGGVRQREVKYADAAALAICTNRRLMAPAWGASGWSRGDLHLFSEQLAGVWAEHSERADLPSWGAACGAPEEILDTPGDRGTDGSEGYIRTWRVRVERVQRGVCALIWSGRAGPDTLGEHELIAETMAYLAKRETPRRARPGPEHLRLRRPTGGAPSGCGGAAGTCAP